MARKKRQVPEMNDEQCAALRQFQMIYGDCWKNMMIDFHMGRIESRAASISHFIRQIRNHISPNPDELPDLRS